MRNLGITDRFENHPEYRTRLGAEQQVETQMGLGTFQCGIRWREHAQRSRQVVVPRVALERQPTFFGAAIDDSVLVHGKPS